ncbi:MAG: polyprenyl synthetase family protein [Aestuariivirgaceae bacterium]
MTFQAALKQTAEAVDNMLDALMPLDTPVRRVVEAMRYASLSQGKRLRPFFVMESARLFDANETGALRTGVALECVHCYSLVHDDLPAMDDDDLRRGKPTCHIAFDEATAILAGDGLLTFAFEILASPKTHDNAAVRAELVLALARAAGKDGMAGGQMLDLLAEQRTGQGLEEIMLIQSLKTGALFGFSLEAGAILAGAGDDDRQALRTYADRIGLAFQIADDILDIESTPEQLGKQTQKDADAGKSTFIDLFGLEGAKAKASQLVDEAVSAVERYGNKAVHLQTAARFVIDRKN